MADTTAPDSSSPFKSDILKGKVAFITGGGSGINFGIAQALAAHGAHIAMMGRREEVLKKACEELASKFGVKTFFKAGDVRDADQCAAALKATNENFGHIDILVNGAAGNFLAPPELLSPNGFKTVIDIDLNGTFNMCRHGYQYLKASKGIIINISANLHYVGTLFQSHVSAAKAGVDALTMNLAAEWGHEGIRVNGIAPGPIGDTEGMKRLAPGEAGEKLKKLIPLQRFGSVQDIGLAAVFLCSSAASYITGETLVVDGGHWFAKPPMVPREIVEKMMAASRS
ncbi:MAG: SDR family oxidoreductase [Chitinophagaceae bacterium]|nr:SDR family oxidoreductase [Oligoflexus sp.]